MKLPIEKILPIVLCLVFPPLNAITTRGITDLSEVNGIMFTRWFSISAMLYILWHLLAYVTEKAQTYKWIKVVIAGVVFCIVTYNVFLLTDLFQRPSMKWMFVIKYFIAIIPFLIIQYAFRANKRVAQLELEKQQMQTENYKVQLESLRAKVDPHFLFNSLNTLRTMVRNKDEKSEQFVLSLSDFYRQTLQHDETTTIDLKQEVKVLESFLFLMKNRNEQAVHVSIAIDEKLNNYQIPTLALQTVVENCFKHNMMTSRSPLTIEIRSTDADAIEVRNTIQAKIEPPKTSGYGLENLKKRYELLGIQNGVEIRKNETEFTTVLKLIRS